VKIESFRCDICGDSYKPEHGTTVSVVYEREADASGNGYNDVTKEVDCCQGCVALALLSWEKLKAFIDRAR